MKSAASNPFEIRATRRGIMWSFTLALAFSLVLGGCGDAHDAKHHTTHPAKVEATGDAGFSRLTLTERAVERLGIELAEVMAAGDGLAAPYGALLYDAQGGTWVYVSPQPNVFQRAAVEVERIEGDTLYLRSGPAVGTRVVIVGAAELHGAEFEIGH